MILIEKNKVYQGEDLKKIKPKKPRGALHTDFIILLNIYEHQLNEEPIWYSRLVSEFQDNIEDHIISYWLDVFYDLGILKGEWRKVSDDNAFYDESKYEDSRWTRCYTLTHHIHHLLDNMLENESGIHGNE
jgi:hypothetical protein